MRVALAAVVFALAACGTRHAAPVALDLPYEWTPVAASTQPPTVPLSFFEVTYSLVSAELHRAIVDASTMATVVETSLGKASGVHAIAGTASLIVDDDDGVVVVNAHGARHRFGQRVSPLPVGAASNAIVYIGDRERISLADSDGNVTRSFDAPRAKPGLPVLPPGYKGVIQPNGSRVSAFVFAGAGEFVAVSGIANSAIVRIDDGRRVDLIGIAPVLDVAYSGNRAYVLGFDTTRLDPPFVLAEIDLSTLDVLHTTRFTVDRPARSIDGTRVLATQGGEVYAYFAVPARVSGLPIRSALMRFDAALVAEPVALPNDLGSDAVVGADGALYLFGGVAGNVASRFDPLTGDIARYTLAPDGAYIRALVAR